MKTVEDKVHSAPALSIVVGATKTRARKHFDPEALSLLTENIRTFGQKVPGLCFININGDLELIAGERRLRACMALQSRFKYLLENEVTDELLYELEIMENLQRENLTWQEEILQFLAYHRFLEDKYGAPRPGIRGGHTMEKTAQRLGVSKGRLSQDLELADWTNAVPEVANAKGKTEAFKIVKRFKETAERSQLLAEAKARMDAVRGASGAPKEKIPEDTLSAFHVAYAEQFGTEALEDMKMRAEAQKKEQEERRASFLAKSAEELEKEIDPVALSLSIYEERVLHGEMVQNLTPFSDEYFDLVIFDPPWGVDFASVKKEEGSQKTYEDNPAYFADTLEIWLRFLYQKMSKDSHLYLFFGMPNHELVYTTLQEVGFETNGLPILWKKKGAHRTRNPKVWPGRCYEPIAFARKGSKDLVALGSPDIKETPAPTTRIKLIHPSAKHPEIMLDLLLRSAKPGDRVLDPMCGSGMTLVACEKLKATLALDWYGIEKDQDFRELALFNLLQGYDKIAGEPTAPDEDEEVEEAKRQLAKAIAEVGAAEATERKDFRLLEPGTGEWKLYWAEHKEEQDEMLKWMEEMR